MHLRRMVNLCVVNVAAAPDFSRAYSAIGAIWIHVARIAAYVGLRLRMQRYSVQRFGRHAWAAGPGLGSVLVSLIPVRHRSPAVSLSVIAQTADGGGRQ